MAFLNHFKIEHDQRQSKCESLHLPPWRCLNVKASWIKNYKIAFLYQQQHPKNVGRVRPLPDSANGQIPVSPSQERSRDKWVVVLITGKITSISDLLNCKVKSAKWGPRTLGYHPYLLKSHFCVCLWVSSWACLRNMAVLPYCAKIYLCLYFPGMPFFSLCDHVQQQFIPGEKVNGPNNMGWAICLSVMQGWKYSLQPPLFCWWAEEIVHPHRFQTSFFSLKKF